MCVIEKDVSIEKEAKIGIQKNKEKRKIIIEVDIARLEEKQRKSVCKGGREGRKEGGSERERERERE